MVEERFITSVAENSIDKVTLEANASSSPHRRVQPLPAVLGTGDLIVLMVLIVLFVANNNGVQLAGPAAFFYWGLGLLTFLLPCAYVTRWLALRFPGQGAPYLWATRILGVRWSFFSAFAAWLPGVLVIVAAIQSSLIFVQYLAPSWFTTPIEQGLAIVLILILPTAIACLPLRLLKRILLALATFYVSVFVLLGAAGIWWIYSGHVAATAFNTAGAWIPNKGNFAVYGVVILAYLGVDVPLFMGGEIRGGKTSVRRATTYVWWGIAIVFLAYVLGTFGVMAIVPAAQSGGMSANVIAISMVFGPVAGKFADIVLAIGQVALTIAYILTFSRLLVVVAQDGRLPAALTKLNRRGAAALVRVDEVDGVELVAAVVALVSPSFRVAANRALALDVAVRERAPADRVERAHLRLLDEVALLVELQEQVLRDALVVARRGAREDVVRHPQAQQVVDDQRVVPIHELARRDALTVRLVRDRGAVLVGPARHQHARAAKPLEACQHVGGHGKARHMSDVARPVRVRPRGGDEDGSLLRHLR